MKNINEMIKSTVAKCGKKLTDEEKRQHEEALAKVFIEGIPPKDAMGITDDMMKALYGYAYNLYQGGKYEEANHAFRLLCMFEPGNGKYSLGLAACHHMQKHYQHAIEAYMLTAYVEPDNPLPFYHISDCYQQIGEPWCAVFALNNMLDRIDVEKNPEYAMVKDRAVMTLEKLKKELGASEEPAKVKKTVEKGKKTKDSEKKVA